MQTGREIMKHEDGKRIQFYISRNKRLTLIPLGFSKKPQETNLYFSLHTNNTEVSLVSPQVSFIWPRHVYPNITRLSSPDTLAKTKNVRPVRQFVGNYVQLFLRLSGQKCLGKINTLFLAKNVWVR